MSTEDSFSLHEISIPQLLDAYSSGDIKVQDVVRHYLDQIEAIDRSGPSLNSIITTNDFALTRAEELDEHLRSTNTLAGPLHGVVIVVKDNIDTAEMDTTCGSEALLGFRPEKDAVAVARLREAGAVILSKSTLPDFATSWWSYSSVSGETKNPYALDHDPGGSSAGSAAAVAANLAVAGLGTDCGGSVRIPASFCNLVGIRSTPGVVPRTGTGFLVAFQDTVGPLARSVQDAVAIFDAMAGYDNGDPFSVSATVGNPPTSYLESVNGGMQNARVGLVTNALGDESDPRGAAMNLLMRKAVEDLEDAGAEVVDVQIPNLMDYLIDTSQYVACSRHDVDVYLREREPLNHLRIADIVAEGRYHKQLDLLEALVEGPEQPEDDPDYSRRFVVREEFTRVILDVMAQNSLDALTYPVTRVPAPSNTERDEWTVLSFPTNTLIASQALLPSVTVPAGFTEDGIPAGIELVTRPYDEASGFRIAAAFEAQSKQRRAPKFT
ncbi:amidase [Nesterenkonia sp. LB17]|uniref:amidase n=1 Tax=unclassified Nesterenkonia TaxID=2629769 RepID=UPI001F4CAE01|nr:MULTISPECIES: amidase [unclassified Nesterenkonia]MCH8559174.1 amidase [Nesterenkonia sp. DZ6]MCH8565097.1 amidase [Nesterenkonia sp. LB17]MCH8571521.1 amidase [Nesterenkonia sp. AY15]